ncbi:BglG family transcription antiterminator [Saccharococcus caldoxylosilyticus]|uniref:Putative fructose operon transcriptional regulator n=1 Tax=Parageobacillus caldoxylosilyticus NBRC 107762 TaxID=1220594 RepID=A0A023DB24_9BACL|nr:BglG family transcription antiterminator [Parageobacillus caldoxylosilyticus]MBB3851239.1 activator of the mannose operon (transcriptional antiterminator) [Parageobacillus caldoxylosilyticus]GAJ38519.1 putative fructose operon transcriptional regulator [Parageobacillus caldoxylosilyticus NBRC 107762]
MLSRHKQLLKQLLAAHTHTSVATLASQLVCSEKTIRNDLKALDEFLSEKYPNIVIERKPSVGVIIRGKETEKQKLLHDLARLEETNSSQDYRKLQLIKILLTEDKPVTMQQLAERFYISKPAIQNDLEEIEQWLQSFGLVLIRKPHLGIKVEGTEQAWRTALSRLVELLVDHSYYIFDAKQLKLIEDVLKPYELALIEKEIRKMDEWLEFPLTDQSVISLTVHIAIAIKRIKMGHRIDIHTNQLQELQTKPEYRLAEQLAKQIEQWIAVKIPDEEIGYITLHLLGARLRYDQTNEKKDIEQLLTKMDNEALQIVKELIHDISLHTDERLRKDKELLIGLTIHIHSTLNRLRNGLAVKNPLLKDIKQMYRYPFEIVLSLIPKVEKKINVPIPEDEVAYIVLHIQAALERIQHKNEKIRAVIVCATGSGTSRLIEAKISAAFPKLEIAAVASIAKLNEIIAATKPDVLISTVPLEHRKIPVITVSPLLPKQELDMIEQWIERVSRPSRYEMLRQLMNPSCIFLDISVSNRFEAIDYIANELCKRGYVKQLYGQSAKEREALSSTYIGGGIAIPHGQIQWINQSVVAVARLSSPIDWDGEQVKFVLMIAHRLNDNRQIKKLFQEIALLSEDEQMLKQLSICKTADEFINYFKSRKRGEIGNEINRINDYGID